MSKLNLNSMAGFYFGCNHANEEAAVSDEQLSELACVFHEEEIYPKKGQTLFEATQVYAKLLAERAGLEDVTIEKGENLSVDVLAGGNTIMNFDVDVYVPEESRDKAMANGEPLSNMENYGWDEFDKLEESYKNLDFADAVESISENNGPKL